VLETVDARVELLLSVAASESLVVLLTLRLPVFEEVLLVLSEAVEDLLASSEADLSEDLEAEASSESDTLDDFEAEASNELDWVADLEAAASRLALDDLESVAARLLSAELSCVVARLPVELEVSADVSAVVWLPFRAAPPLEADMSCAVVPLEAELSLPLVAVLLYAVLPLLLAEPSEPAMTAFPVEFVLLVELLVDPWVAEALPVEEFDLEALAFNEESLECEPVAESEAFALFEEELSFETEASALFDAV
jgi:hypothetical protein